MALLGLIVRTVLKQIRSHGMKGGNCNVYAHIKLVPMHAQRFLYVLLYDALVACRGQLSWLGQQADSPASAAGKGFPNPHLIWVVLEMLHKIFPSIW